MKEVLHKKRSLPNVLQFKEVEITNTIKNHTLKKVYAAIFTAIVASIIVCLLGLTGCYTPKLEQDPETVDILQEVFPEVGYYHYDEEAELYTVYDASRKEIGYAFYARGHGHHGLMIFLVGLKDKETIESVAVIKHSEHLGGIGEQPGPPLNFTPLTEQFVGLKIEDCYIIDDYGPVDVITSASISSRNTVDIIRKTALEKIGPMESKIKWQNMSVLLLVISVTLIPVVFIWYATIKRARAK